MTSAVVRQASRRAVIGLAVGLLAMAAGLVASAAAQSGDNGGIVFGPTGAGPGNASAFDRDFVKEWEGNPPPGYPTLSPANVAATKAAIKRFGEIVEKGGWPVVPEVQMEFGQTHFAVSVLKKRLAASGELDGEGDFSEYFDSALEKAVKRFQASNGLTPTGIVDKRTIPALNVTAEVRLRQLKLNVGRLQEFTGRPAKQKYVAVNIPAAQVEAVEGDKVVSRHTAVVGKPERPTPLLTTTIYQMNFNPVWRLPPTVITKDLIPRGREMQKAGKNVLVKFGIDAYDGNGKKLDPEKVDWGSNQPAGLSYSQQPGKENPLGFLKINFANSHSVYMHDTPSETLFGRNFRAASSGCIRVHNIEQLAVWLLAGNESWSKGRIEVIREKGLRQDVNLKKPVPLYFTYITAWATPDGLVQFRRDIYDRDGAGEAASAY